MVGKGDLVAGGGLGRGKSWCLLGARPAQCECLTWAGLKMWGDGNRCLRPSPKRAMGLPGLAVFVAALGCLQTSFPSAWEMTFDLCVLLMGTVLLHAEHLG